MHLNFGELRMEVDIRRVNSKRMEMAEYNIYSSYERGELE